MRSIGKSGDIVVQHEIGGEDAYLNNNKAAYDGIGQFMS